MIVFRGPALLKAKMKSQHFSSCSTPTTSAREAHLVHIFFPRSSPCPKKISAKLTLSNFLFRQAHHPTPASRVPLSLGDYLMHRYCDFWEASMRSGRQTRARTMGILMDKAHFNKRCLRWLKKNLRGEQALLKIPADPLPPPSSPPKTSSLCLWSASSFLLLSCSLPQGPLRYPFSTLPQHYSLPGPMS